MPQPYNDFGKYREIALKDLLDIHNWQKILDNFSDITDIYLRIISPEGTLLAASGKKPRLCAELLKDSSAKEMICGPCLPTFLYGKATVNKNLSFFCDAGLYNFINPLTINKDKILGYLIMGPVILVMRKPKEEYAHITQEFGLELDDFWTALLEIKAISFHCAQSLVALIKSVAEHMLKSAYNETLADEERVKGEDASKNPQLLEALLDVAFEISKADIGSVMFLDNLTREFTIQVSRGIPEAIVKNARVKTGIGIAGIAIKEGKPLLIGHTPQDNRLTPYLHRPQLGSSMVIPLKVENTVLGVMNVGALNTSQIQFGQDNITLMNKLVELATAAIEP